MTARTYSLRLLGLPILACGMLVSGGQLLAQAPGGQYPQSQPGMPGSAGQQPGMPPGAAGQQAPPDTQAPSQETAGQTFSGVIVKQGDKYVLQDASTGTTYDIDHQDQVAKYEGKRVRVRGTLDPGGKMIHIQ